MNNRHRRVERLRRKYETPAERWSREIMQAFLRDLAINILKDLVLSSVNLTEWQKLQIKDTIRLLEEK